MDVRIPECIDINKIYRPVLVDVRLLAARKVKISKGIDINKVKEVVIVHVSQVVNGVHGMFQLIEIGQKIPIRILLPIANAVIIAV